MEIKNEKTLSAKGILKTLGLVFGDIGRAVFYGLEDIAAKNLLWKMFALIKRVTPTFIQFYKIPPKKLYGVITKVSM
jgi:K+ transporter